MHGRVLTILAGRLFLLQVAATFFMTGLIWFVQIVHYPLFAVVGDAAFVPYARRHATLTGYVVALPMLVELATALLTVVPSLRPALLPARAALASALLVLLLWVITGVVQVPLHTRLGQQRDPALIAQLVRGNWIRTLLWSTRSLLMLDGLRRLLEHS